MKRLVARNVDLGSIVAERVSVADTRATRRTGLLKHDSLPPGEALWIVPSRGVHTFGMRFTIDVVALDERGTVIDCVPNMKPWRLRLPRRGTAGVLELPAGSIAAGRIALGHRILFHSTETVDAPGRTDRGQSPARASGARSGSVGAFTSGEVA